MSELRTNRIVPRDGLPSGSSGGIIQVKSTTKTTHQSILESSGSSAYPSGAVDIMTVSITPTRADSKILVSSTVQAASTNAAILYMYRDSTVINAGTDGSTANNNAYQGWAHVRFDNTDETYSYTTQFLDSPASTSAQTYMFTISHGDSGQRAIYINKTDADSNNYQHTRGISTLTLYEVTG